MKSIIFESMKTILFSLLIFTTFVTLYSCQDEFCSDATTPQLIIRFHDKDTIANKKEIQLITWIGLDTLEQYTGNTTDSIVIPLNTVDTSVTYNLSILDSIDSEETLTVNYTVEDVFVSKSCGFKSVFNNVTFTSTNNNWLNSIEQISTKITNENQVHVQIFH